MTDNFCIVLPVRNEAPALPGLLTAIAEKYPRAEVLAVDDGSTDDSAHICAEHNVRVIAQPYSKGNGAAIKAGARHANSEVVVFMDADGQHDPADIAKLLAALASGFDMAVGARDPASQASVARRMANWFYSRLASWVVGHPIQDLTSGFRAVRLKRFKEFMYLLPNGFSYPSTITMAFFRAGYSVGYVSIRARRREGRSHIRILRDGARFLIIIFKIGTLYSPLKVFAPAAALFFLSGLGYYAYTYATVGRFTNMSALLIIVSFIVFLIGLVSEQTTALMYGMKSDSTEDVKKN